ncbi:exodeoxyribonuclease VII large subunit [Tianweitania sp. BSSL-BM11]|uniref:Exodeoxyribonuclease 7 large subunit n=1 Tax=Tianweitania aestuarii TaxID=2814886 RepID=A0ABS5RR80_9HYPH|nr:exodeoxyribonuclease VII large subunit [Tianweitania aestuarii]MBS9719467.1 exodeoxyribonuclease VII large subunit [Tianweitania aestuarii]
MPDLLSPAPLTNATEYSVSEISGALKRTVEDQFGHVRVRGEISGYRGPHSSGHAYFGLKDDRAKLEAVVWKATMAKLRFRPEEGMEVVATGKLTTYPGSSKYQIVIDNLEPAGAGALMALLEERKKRLAAEGLFDAAHKQDLPFMPRVIGVVTSPTGAVIRDILHRIADRFPLHVIVWPVRVQGETSGSEVCAAINGFNQLPVDGPIRRPDVIIVARGGGSLEDLWGFNDESCARAVSHSRIPLIAAVGHETDWTLIDLVADRRAPTPTGAAEMAVPVKAELEARIASLGARLRGCMSRGMDRRTHSVRSLARALPSADAILAMPRRHFDEVTGRLERSLETSTHRRRVKLDGLRLSPAVLSRRTALLRRELGRTGERLPAANRRQLDAAAARLPAPDRLSRLLKRKLDHDRALFQRVTRRMRPAALVERLSTMTALYAALEARRDRALALRLSTHRTGLAQSERMLGSLSYKAVLKRGFAVVHDTQGKPITAAAAVSPGERLSLEFADGRIDAIASGEAPLKPKSAKKAAPPAEGQGRLF